MKIIKNMNFDHILFAENPLKMRGKCEKNRKNAKNYSFKL